MEHRYDVAVTWTGDTGRGTADYRAYERAHTVEVAGKPPLLGSADPAFRGDPGRHNPEELLVASLSSCHLLWYLHLAAAAGIVVVGYRDEAVGTMATAPDGTGRFTRVVLRPTVTVTDPQVVEAAQALHAEANRHCFIAASVSFPVEHEPTVTVRA